MYKIAGRVEWITYDTMNSITYFDNRLANAKFSVSLPDRNQQKMTNCFIWQTKEKVKQFTFEPSPAKHEWFYF